MMMMMMMKVQYLDGVCMRPHTMMVASVECDGSKQLRVLH
jgi:hypothetical protein